MIHDIPKPELSPDFTMEDIRKLRYWFYERTKDATTEEMLEDIRVRAAGAREWLGYKEDSRSFPKEAGSVFRTKIYLDTSVISHLDAPDTPEKMADTWAFWRDVQANKYDVVVSDATITELQDTAEPKRSTLLAYLNSISHEVIAGTDDVFTIAAKFVEIGILSQSSLNDCIHIASAMISKCHMVVSWNFKHIVKRKTIDGAAVIAAIFGIHSVRIFSPTMLLEAEDDT